ncbi:MAG: ATP-dependent zinc metalloprotease FtsH [Gemmatimonadota bacterium]|nr:ATP-dependent zinc metalloprotease FtsH [Gemmatimonadota bacterium]
MAEHKEQEETPDPGQKEKRPPVPELKPESDEDRDAPLPPRDRRRQRHNREPGSAPENDGSEWRRRSKTLAFWVFFVLVALFATRFFGSSTGSGDVVISYKEYRTLMKQGKIESAVIIDSDFHGTLLEPEYTTSRGGQQAYRTFVVNLGVIGEDAIADWEKYEIDFRFQEKPFDWLKVFFNFLPWLLFVGLWLFIFRQMQGGPKGAFSFGKSRAKLVSEDRPKVTFKDVAGSDEAKQELQEIIEYLKDPRKFQRLGGRIPKGVLLVGPPGTGKTYMAKAVAGEAGVPFYSMSGSDFVEMFVGVGASRVRDLFEQGKANAPCIIFIDEIDAVGRHRGAGIGGGHDEREQTLNQLLVEMDGFDSKEGVILIAATNRPDVLDPALLRPGRFDRQVVVDRPDVKGREGVLKVHIRNTPLDKDVDLTVLARATPGFSQADLENLVNEAALLASRHDRTSVIMEDFENAKDKVIMGVERRSLVISDSEKKRTAYHEIGHALVAKLVPESDPVHKVTIIPRGQSLGLTTYLPIDERHNYSRSYSDAVLTYALGGRVAEKIVFGEVSSGGQQDYKMATDLARRMVCDWGMSEELGPVSYGNRQDEVFLGREMAQRRDFSEKVAQVIDDEIRNFVLTAEERAESLLRENIAQVHVLADALLEFEVLDDSQLDRILAGEKLQKPPEPPESQNGRTKQDAADDVDEPETPSSEETTAESTKTPEDDD